MDLKGDWGKIPLHGHLVSLGIELGKPTHFTVNAKAAGKGKLDVQFSGLAKGDAVRDMDIIDHHDNTYTVKYTPVQQVASYLNLPQLHPFATPTKPMGLLEEWPGCFVPGGFLPTLIAHLRHTVWQARGGKGEPVLLWPPSHA